MLPRTVDNVETEERWPADVAAIETLRSGLGADSRNALGRSLDVFSSGFDSLLSAGGIDTTGGCVFSADALDSALGGFGLIF